MKFLRRLGMVLCPVAFCLAVAAVYFWSKAPYRRVPLDEKSVAQFATDGRPLLRPSFSDLPYANKSPFERLDLYLPRQSKGPAPLVIWIHGGGFTMGDKSSMPRRDYGSGYTPLAGKGPYQVQVPDVDALTARGYAVVSLNYQLGIWIVTAAKSAVQDGKAAIRFLRANAGLYGLDPNRFAVWGNSAGGYMATLLGVTGDQASAFDNPDLGHADESSAVQAVVVWFGAIPRLASSDSVVERYLAGHR